MYPDGDDIVRCRHCASPWLRKWGAARGRPRYRCYECGRTSVVPPSDPAGAERAERLHRDVLLSMLDPAPLIESAAALGIDPKRLQLERHRLMQAFIDCAAPAPLTGEVLLVRVPDPNRRLCMYALATTACARPRLVPGPLNPHEIAAEPILRENVAAGADLLVHGQVWDAFARGSAQLHIRCYWIGSLPPDRARPPVASLFAYGRNAWKWMIRFRGFRAEYLPRYIAWYQAIQSVRDAPDRAAAWLDLCERAVRPPSDWL